MGMRAPAIGAPAGMIALDAAQLTPPIDWTQACCVSGHDTRSARRGEMITARTATHSMLPALWERRPLTLGSPVTSCSGAGGGIGRVPPRLAAGSTPVLVHGATASSSPDRRLAPDPR